VYKKADAGVREKEKGSARFFHSLGLKDAPPPFKDGFSTVLGFGGPAYGKPKVAGQAKTMEKPAGSLVYHYQSRKSLRYSP